MDRMLYTWSPAWNGARCQIRGAGTPVAELAEATCHCVIKNLDNKPQSEQHEISVLVVACFDFAFLVMR